ncbi:MAG: RNA polymerase sigma factor [bacterium]|nr:RNA polymerase sigma factor [bacterium]
MPPPEDPMQPLPSPVDRTDPDTASLVARARLGDRQAFEQIYRRHVGRMHAVCLRLTGDANEAEAAVQDAFVRAWRGLGGFRGDSALGTWLHRLAVNAALDRRREFKRREGRHDDIDAQEEAAAPQLRVLQPTPGAAWDLERAVAALPPGARTAFVLFEIEGYRLTEIAALTGTATGTVKAQLHRARTRLKEMLS